MSLGTVHLLAACSNIRMRSGWAAATKLFFICTAAELTDCTLHSLAAQGSERSGISSTDHFSTAGSAARTLGLSSTSGQPVRIQHSASFSVRQLPCGSAQGCLHHACRTM